MKIVKSLGGLPPIKIHCSVLATEALKEAVYDYYKKNKRPIPKGLQAVHKRVKAVRESIEHMH
jgi:nitrogen fixation NifU-like protein